MSRAALSKKDRKPIDDIRFEYVADDKGVYYVEVYPTFADGSTVLIPEWTFYPMWVTPMRHIQLNPKQRSLLMDEAIYRGQHMGYDFTPEFLRRTEHVGV